MSTLFFFFFLRLPGTGEASKLPAEGREEVSGPSHRIGLSGANKTMLHLLKKAKVQLIKIDQQKQLKLSQVRCLTSRVTPGTPLGLQTAINVRRKKNEPAGVARL